MPPRNPAAHIDNILASVGVKPADSPVAKVRKIKAAITSLSAHADSLSTFRTPPFVFDPVKSEVIAFVMATALFAQESTPLSSALNIYGSGIYALFYNGAFPAYAQIAGRNVPIYVGSAQPKDSRANTPEEQGTSLSTRLNEHRKSIEAAQRHHGAQLPANLRIEDVSYRYLVVKSGWELSVEQYLIRLFKPVWNKETKICFGFGKHGDSSETRANKRSPWDTIHPGRAWALSSPEGASASATIDSIRAHLAANSDQEISIRSVMGMASQIADEPEEVTTGDNGNAE